MSNNAYPAPGIPVETESASGSPEASTPAFRNGRNSKEVKLEHKTPSCWTHNGAAYNMVGSTCDKLPPAVYNVWFNANDQVTFGQAEQTTDEVFDLPGLPIDFISDQIDKFWERQTAYEAYNFIHKRGVILHGPPGNGKTCVITSLVKRLLAKGGVILNVTNFTIASDALTVLKKVEPQRKVMTLIEDMDTLLSGESKTQEQAALSMLDGQNQVNGVVHIATTNYPEKLEDRFIKRPGRFDLVIGMDLPIEITRRAYFQQILRDDCHPELEYLVDKTEGMALAYLREIASSYLCLGIPIEETLVRLRKNLNTTLKTSKGYGKSSLGFTVGYEGKE